MKKRHPARPRVPRIMQRCEAHRSSRRDAWRKRKHKGREEARD